MGSAPRTLSLTDESDVIDPASEDWTEVDDGSVFDAALNGVPQAIAEARRRGLSLT